MIRVLAYNALNNTKSTNGVYLHGALEDKARYDLCYVKGMADLPGLAVKDKNLILEDGIYECEVVMPDGAVCNATLYYWVNEDTRLCGHRGVIVDPADIEGVKYATYLYNKRSPWIMLTEEDVKEMAKMDTPDPSL
jgi:hypothetical protein